MIRVALPGAAGKMGRVIARLLAATPGVVLATALERAGQPLLGQDVGALAGLAPNGVLLTAELEVALAGVDVAIDFTAPAATVALAAAAAARGVALVIGTTGLDGEQRAAIAAAAAQVPVVFSPNMSVGVNVLFGLLERAAQALGDGYDVEIVELHHRLKRDAPSGTAVRMAEVVAAALGRDLGAVGVYGRHGEVGPRRQDEIGVMTVRGGDVVGEHTAYFFGPGERIEISHRASSRETFAHGAVRAAQWLVGRAPGLYDMRDVLGLRRA